jgi:hypothetical protein
MDNNQKTEFLQSVKKNLYDDNDAVLRLFLTVDKKNLENPLQYFKNFFQSIRKITTSKNRIKILLWFIDHKIGTVNLIVKDIGISWQSVYREINILNELGYLVKVIKHHNHSKSGGRSPDLWGLKGFYGPEDIVDAIQKNRIIKQPIYEEARRTSQLVFDDYIQIRQVKEITKNELIPILKSYTNKFYAYDLYPFVRDFLKEKYGIRTWE